MPMTQMRMQGGEGVIIVEDQPIHGLSDPFFLPRSKERDMDTTGKIKFPDGAITVRKLQKTVRQM